MAHETTDELITIRTNSFYKLLTHDILTPLSNYRSIFLFQLISVSHTHKFIPKTRKIQTRFPHHTFPRCIYVAIQLPIFFFRIM